MYSKFIPLVQLRLLPELSACAEKHKLMEMEDFGGGGGGKGNTCSLSALLYA